MSDSKEKEYVVESDTFYAVGTLADFKTCAWDEDDKYHTKGDALYYGDDLIGWEKG